MKQSSLQCLLAHVVFLIALLFVTPASAHGDEPRIEISAERLNPGSVLDLRGVDFEFEEEVVLLLVGPQVEVPLGTVLADAEGIFLLTITLPPDLTEGTYVIRATTDDHVVESPQITVWGTADLGGGEDGPVDEEDGLLMPIPTHAPNIPTPLLSSASSVETATQPEKSSTSYIWIAAGIGIILLLGILIRIRR